MIMAKMLMKMLMIRKILEVSDVGDDEMNKYEDSPPRQLGYKNIYKQIVHRPQGRLLLQNAVCRLAISFDFVAAVKARGNIVLGELELKSCTICI